MIGTIGKEEEEEEEKKKKKVKRIHCLSKIRTANSSCGNLSKFVEEFAEQFGNEAIDVVRIISFVLRAFLRVLNEAAARLSSGVSGIPARRIDSGSGESMQTMRAELSVNDTTHRLGACVSDPRGPTRTHVSIK